MRGARFWLLACGMWAMVLGACGQRAKSPAPEASPSSSGWRFRLSERSPAEMPDLCRQPFPEGVPLNAVHTPDKRRSFMALKKGQYRIGILGANTLAALMLNVGEGRDIEVLSSDQLPQCLSNSRNLSLSPTADALRYNNLQYIDCTIRVGQGAQQEPVLTLEYDSANEYGFEVYRCADCL